MYNLARKKFEAGLIPKVEALQMKVDLAESRNNLVAAEGELSRAEDSFKQLIGLKLTDQVGVQTEFDYHKMDMNPEKAIRLALENRSEVREAEIDVQLVHINVKEADLKRKTMWDFERNQSLVE